MEDASSLIFTSQNLSQEGHVDGEGEEGNKKSFHELSWNMLDHINDTEAVKTLMSSFDS